MIQPTLFLACPTGSDLKTFTRNQVGVILSLRHLYLNLQENQICKRAAKIIPLTLLFCENIPSYAKFYVEIWIIL